MRAAGRPPGAHSSRARRAQCPFVTTYHGAYGEKTAAKWLYNSVMARGDVVIANSRYTADLIAHPLRDTTPSRIRVIYRGVDRALFDPAGVAPARVAALRVREGASSRVSLWCCRRPRITAWKGQSVLIDAARRLDEQGRLGNAVIILAGDAQGRSAYALGATHRGDPRRWPRGPGRASWAT